MDENNRNSIKSDILEAIHEGKITMRPKWHFMLRSTLAIAGGVIIALTLLYLASLIIFVLRQDGVWFVPVFGPRGWFAFLISLPWLLIWLVLVFIVILEILVRHFAFAYRRPLLYSALAILCLVVLGGFLVAATGLHRHFGRYAVRNGLPFAGPLYRDAGRPTLPDVRRGKVLNTTTTGFIMKSIPGDIVRVIITPRTRLPYGMDLIPGDGVIVFGHGTATTVEAFGMREVDNDSD